MNLIPKQSKPKDGFLENLAVDGLIRRSQLIPGIVPVSSSTLRRMIKRAEFPAPVSISPRCKAWKVSDIQSWLNGPKQRASMDECNA